MLIVRASRPALGKYGLSITQLVIQHEDGKSYLNTRMMHSSGQWLESNMQIDPPKRDIQSLGSYITYLRRYAYSAMVGVISGNEDDDGEAAMKESRRQEKEKKSISQGQVTILSEALEGHMEILERLLTGLKIKKLSEIPAARYTDILNRVREQTKEA